MKSHYIINLGRQLGSGGKEIGEKLAEALGFSFYDKELIQLAANESGLSQEFFEKTDERASKGFWNSIFASSVPLLGENALPYMNCLNDESLFQIQSEVIVRLAEEKSCLFVGRCADYILRNRPHVINVFISAPLEFRVERVVASTGLSPEKAEEYIEKIDRQRSSYYNCYSYKTWGAASSYHLCIDSSLLGIEQTAHYLAELVKEVTEKNR
ncbi:MAG: AAA family ATPase [Phocaeicola sp.]